MTTTTAVRTDLSTQSGHLLEQVAGYVAHRTVELGLRSGLLHAIDEVGPASAPDLAARLDLDPFYVEVWARAALAAGVVERRGPGYALAPHMDTLLLDRDAPGYVGGVFEVLARPEVFDHFGRRLADGTRVWWSDLSPEWIAGVASTGRPFYTRLVPDGLARVPGLPAVLDERPRILETACGAGMGLARLATTYPDATVVGVDGDAHSLALAADHLRTAGVDDRVELVHSPLEDLDVPPGMFDLVVNNISMHECRDIDAVTAATRAHLRPGGWFVISDFPFPEDDEGLRRLPGRVMSGIQVFEAQIDDQLLPVSRYLDLLTRHGFTGVDTTTLTPVHALTYGRTPTEG